MGVGLVPAEISRALGCQPTSCHARGDTIAGKRTGSSRTATSGLWLLAAAERWPADLDGQIVEILGKLTPDLAKWAQITTGTKLDLFCGLFLDGDNEGLAVSAANLAALGQRGIALNLDIYGGYSGDG